MRGMGAKAEIDLAGGTAKLAVITGFDVSTCLRCVCFGGDGKAANCLRGTDGAMHLRSYGELDKEGWEQLLAHGTRCCATSTFTGGGSK
jgi:hypothetical protein